MATVVLQAAGAAIGSVFGPIGAMAGRAIGALAGAAIDQALFAPGSTPTGRLATARIPGPDEGTAIPRLYGTARIGGTLIWATRFREEVTSERQGSKGGKRSENYDYSVSIALGLCEGPIAGIRRIFADGRALDLSGLDYRVHTGTKTQAPDPLIEAKQGAGRAPAYRGLAYVVFENLPLKPFGNRIPVLTFEVIRPVGALEQQIRAVTLIPGATEFGYHPLPVTEKTGTGAARILNRNSALGASDWAVSLDELQALCPNLQTVALVVTWFGTSLDAAACRIEPGVEVRVRGKESLEWRVCGRDRTAARLISRSGDGPAYGGTPTDASVIAAIADLRARGLKVVLYPFLMMDVPAGNSLVDPYAQPGAKPGQPAYPWRGRITASPAPGLAGTPDRTPAARDAVDRFFGTATPSAFSVSGTAVSLAGEDAGFARLILHYAQLAKLAGGVDGFLIGSEMKGLTSLRDGADRYPFVERLVTLAGQVRGILGPATKLTYGADWSEYSGHQTGDGMGGIRFHLDPLWASPDIDAVGIDNYLPLSDFTDTDLAAAHPDGFRHQEDPAGLEGQVAAGERFDWYYATDADRAARRRSPITDGMAGKPWVYAPKNIAGWWANRHYDRVDGREAAGPTAWQPRMKPVWFTELGCPAIDRGANQPNVFLDPKSVESLAPYGSRGQRADSVQRRFLEAHYRYWNGPKAPAGMVDPARIFVWCWDTRPFPAFPQATGIWSDGPNWRTGHWLNGRLGAGAVADVLAAILTDHGFFDYDVSGVTGDLPGYVKSGEGAARGLIEPLLAAFQIDVTEEGGRLRFTSRMEASQVAQSLPVLAETPGEPLVTATRGKEADAPAEVLIGFDDPALDYEPARARSRRVAGAGGGLMQVSLPAVLDAAQAAAMAEAMLRAARMARRGVSFRVAPMALALQPGDVVTLPQGPPGRYLVDRIEDGARAGEGRLVEAQEWAPLAATAPPPVFPPQRQPGQAAQAAFAPEVLFLDLPALDEGGVAGAARVAALSTPWRPVLLSASGSTEDFQPVATLERPARIGQLAAPLAASTLSGRFDPARTLVADFSFSAPQSSSRLDVLSGRNRLAVVSTTGALEIIGYQKAEETAPGRFRLSGLLNGLAGTEDAMNAGAATGAAVALLNSAVVSLNLGESQRGLGRNYMAEPAGLAGGQAGPFRFAGGLRAETPVAPVHLRARLDPDGALALSWVARGRLGADGWDASEIPLDSAPRFQLRLMAADGREARLQVTAATRCRYAPEAQLADFGGPLRLFSLTVNQIGRRVPAGLPATARFDLST